MVNLVSKFLVSRFLGEEPQSSHDFAEEEKNFARLGGAFNSLYLESENLTGESLLGATKRMAPIVEQIQAIASKCKEDNEAGRSMAGRVRALQEQDSNTQALFAEALARTDPSSTPARSTSSAPVALPGLYNASANCWINSLLQMITHVPSLEAAYRGVALYYRDGGDNIEAEKGQVTPSREQRMVAGQTLIEELDKLKIEQALARVGRGRGVFFANTQKVREALHTLCFGVGPSAKQHEDAQDVLQSLVGRYERVTGRNLSYCTTFHVTREYKDTGRSCEPDAAKLALTRANPEAGNAPYTVIHGMERAATPQLDFQLLLEVDGHQCRTMAQLLESNFVSTSESDSASAYYLCGDDDKLHELAVERVTTKMASHPIELVITARRFGQNNGRWYKVEDRIPMQRYVTLDPYTSLAEETSHYELDSFMVHGGGLRGGHYISYKLIDGSWYEFNDLVVTKKTQKDIDSLIQIGYVYHYRKVDAIPEDYSPPVFSPPPRRQTTGSLATSSSGARIASPVSSRAATAQPGEPDIKSLQDLQGDLERKGSSERAVPERALYTLWLQGGVPNKVGYGDAEYKRNPRILCEANVPAFIAKNGGSILGQLIYLEEYKQKIAEQERVIESLQKVYEASKGISMHATRLFRDLPDEVKLEVGKRLPRASSDGEGEVDPKQFRNVVSKVIEERQAALKKLQNKYYRKQLKAFLSLLADPRLHTDADIKKLQLVKAFEALDIPKEKKWKIHGAIWEHKGSPSNAGLGFGEREFAANPAILKEIPAIKALFS